VGFEALPVTKQRWPDLVELFDRPIVRTCFCMFYRKTGTATSVGRQNRQAMKALVDRGTVPGLIGDETRPAALMYGLPWFRGWKDDRVARRRLIFMTVWGILLGTAILADSWGYRP